MKKVFRGMIDVAIIIIIMFPHYSRAWDGSSFPKGEGAFGFDASSMYVDPSQCPKGSPAWAVNMVNMNLHMVDTPLWYEPAFGPGVNITLSHNSLMPEDELVRKPFGGKWVMNYTGYLDLDQNGDVTVTMPDGRQDTYTPNDDGSYTSSPDFTGIYTSNRYRWHPTGTPNPAVKIRATITERPGGGSQVQTAVYS